MAITPLQTELQDYFNGICCVAPVPPAFSYLSGYNWQVGTAVNACPTVSAGTTPITFSVSPALPAGLSIDTNTGCITGTPTEDIDVTSFTITGTNSTGSFTFSTQITVSPASVSNPPQIDYDTAPFTFEIGVAVNECPSVSGDLPITFSISPSLPAGLALDVNTGCITGTPTTETSNTSYTVTATNATGTDTETFDLETITVYPIIVTNYYTSKANGDADVQARLSNGTFLGSSYNPTTNKYSFEVTPNSEIGGITAFISGGTNVTYEDPLGLIVKYNSLFESIDGLTATLVDGVEVVDGYLGNVLNSNITVGDNFTVGVIGDLTDSTLIVGDNFTGSFTSMFNSTVTIGDNAMFLDQSNESFMGSINSTITVGNNLQIGGAGNAFTQTENCTVTLGSFSKLPNTGPWGNNFFGQAQDCTINLLGSVGNNTGYEMIFGNLMNCEINTIVANETSNSGNIEGDLQELINMGVTVNFTL